MPRYKLHKNPDMTLVTADFLAQNRNVAIGVSTLLGGGELLEYKGGRSFARISLQSDGCYHENWVETSSGNFKPVIFSPTPPDVAEEIQPWKFRGLALLFLSGLLLLLPFFGFSWLVNERFFW